MPSLMAGTLAISMAALAAGGASASAAKRLPTFSVTMTGHSISAPSRIPAGAVNVVSKVRGEAMGSPTLMRLARGVSYKRVFAAALAAHGNPNALQGLASIVFNADAPRGSSRAQTVLTRGNWVAIDTAKNNPARWPHMAFTVTANSAPAALPRPGATIRAEEFRFVGPSSLRDGELVRFKNAGYLAHMVVAFRVRNQAAANKTVALLRAGKDSRAQRLVIGPPPGFVGVFSPRGVVQERIHARPGIYVFACFMTTQDNREHTQLGMEKIVRIRR